MSDDYVTKDHARTVAERRSNSQPATTDHSWWDANAEKVVHHARKTRTARKVTRRARSLKRGVLRWAVLITVAEVFVFVFGYGTKPGGPFGPDPASSCLTGTTVASVEGQSIAVVMARTQGDALRRLAGPPPDPRKTQRLAERAADAVVVSVLALKASAHGQDEPAKVTAYNTAVQQRHARQVAQNVASCTPCPSVPGASDGTTGDGGTMTIAATGSGPETARRAADAAGFTGADLEVAVAVAGAESGYRALATNHNTNGSTDYGLWQINSVHAGLLASADWADPSANARMAHQVWLAAGRSWTPWTAYTSGSYREHLSGSAAAQAIPAGQTIARSGPMTCTASPTGSTAVDSPGAWGGHQNGRIPTTALCSPTFDRRVRLRCDAATALDRLEVAYRSAFGRDLTITDSYRDYLSQVRVKAAKGSLAATPGTSNHGWGLALDLGGGIQSFGSRQYEWMTAHAATFGWAHPSWAQRDGSKPEPWHWEYVGQETAATGRGV